MASTDLGNCFFLTKDGGLTVSFVSVSLEITGKGWHADMKGRFRSTRCLLGELLLPTLTGQAHHLNSSMMVSKVVGIGGRGRQLTVWSALTMILTAIMIRGDVETPHMSNCQPSAKAGGESRP